MATQTCEIAKSSTNAGGDAGARNAHQLAVPIDFISVVYRRDQQSVSRLGVCHRIDLQMPAIPRKARVARMALATP